MFHRYTPWRTGLAPIYYGLNLFAWWYLLLCRYRTFLLRRCLFQSSRCRHIWFCYRFCNWEYCLVFISSTNSLRTSHHISYRIFGCHRLFNFDSSLCRSWSPHHTILSVRQGLLREVTLPICVAMGSIALSHFLYFFQS